MTIDSGAATAKKKETDSEIMRKIWKNMKTIKSFRCGATKSPGKT